MIWLVRVESNAFASRLKLRVTPKLKVELRKVDTWLRLIQVGGRSRNLSFTGIGTGWKSRLKKVEAFADFNVWYVG